MSEHHLNKHDSFDRHVVATATAILNGATVEHFSWMASDTEFLRTIDDAHVWVLRSFLSGLLPYHVHKGADSSDLRSRYSRFNRRCIVHLQAYSNGEATGGLEYIEGPDNLVIIDEQQAQDLITQAQGVLAAYLLERLEHLNRQR